MSRVPNQSCCDMCSKTVLSNDREGWLNVSLIGQDRHRNLVDAMLADGRHGGTILDFCSWICLRDYSVLALLDSPTT